MQRFSSALTAQLGLPADSLIPAYEDVLQQAALEQRLPANLDPLKADLSASAQRRRLVQLLEQGLGTTVGVVLPLEPAKPTTKKPHTGWLTSAWPLRREHLYLLEGDSPLGLRLPLDTLPWVSPEDKVTDFDVDPFAPQAPLEDTPANKSPAAATVTPDSSRS